MVNNHHKAISSASCIKIKIPRFVYMTATIAIWGHSSAGRAPAWHAGGQRFESAWLHLIFLVISRDFKDVFVEA